MLPFRQLVILSLAFLALQQQQLLQNGGGALARPVQQDEAVDQAMQVLATDPRASMPASDDNNVQTTVDPEAVLKALQALADGIEMQKDKSGDAKPVMVISHGDGGPLSGAGGKQSQSQDNDDANVKVKPQNKDPKDTKTNKDTTKDKDIKKIKDDKKKGTKKSTSKAAQNFLQQPRTRFCAQPANTNRTIDDISQALVTAERKRLAKLRKQLHSNSSSHTTDARSLTDARLLADATKTVQVVWHVIHNGRQGNLTQTMVRDQIQVLNDDYAEYGFAFNLSATNRVNNRNYFRNVNPDTDLQDQMKRTLRKGDAKTLNLYSVDFGSGLLGYSSFPWDVQQNLSNDGVVFQYSTVPGGSETGYNLGKTVTHEVGHWLGLYHVFQGGCQSPGDYVEDTPPQSEATNGCPVGQDSCTGGGLDSIHNYMDYSSDACLTEFTEGQAVRMAALTSQYRLL